MDGGAWRAAVRGVAKSRIRLRDFTFTFHFHALEKERATHSSILAWRIPGMTEPGGLPSMGLHGVGHDWRDLAVACRQHHSNGRKQKGAKELLDEDEGGEWKSWQKMQHSINEDHGIWSHEFLPKIVKQWEQWVTLFSWAPKLLWMMTTAKKLKHFLLGRKVMTNLNSSLKSRTFVNKGPYSQSYGFSSSHVWMWELDHKEGRELNNWCFQNVVPEKTLENPLECKEIKPVSLKGNQSWILIERTHAEAETPILWPPDAKSWLTGKYLDAGIDWRQQKKRVREDEMVGQQHRFNGPEFEQAPGVNDGQGSLACCSPWGHKESNTTERLNNNIMSVIIFGYLGECICSLR